MYSALNNNIKETSENLQGSRQQSVTFWWPLFWSSLQPRGKGLQPQDSCPRSCLNRLLTPLGGSPNRSCLWWLQLLTGKSSCWPTQRVIKVNPMYKPSQLQVLRHNPSLKIHRALKFQLCVSLFRTGNFQFPLMQTSRMEQIMILSSSVFKLRLSSSISHSTLILTCLPLFLKNSSPLLLFALSL